LLIIEIRLPPGEINSTIDFWNALGHIAPSIYAFLLSFAVILITWVNHHNSIKLVNKSSVAFIYANGFLLLTVVFFPFPTSLLGEHLFSDHASPAVILYVSTMALQAVGWILMSRASMKGNLAKSTKAAAQIRNNGKFGYFAFALYAVCAVVAIRFPLTIAVVTTLIWIFWLVWGISIKHEEMN